MHMHACKVTNSDVKNKLTAKRLQQLKASYTGNSDMEIVQGPCPFFAVQQLLNEHCMNFLDGWDKDHILDVRKLAGALTCLM